MDLEEERKLLESRWQNLDLEKEKMTERDKGLVGLREKLQQQVNMFEEDRKQLEEEKKHLKVEKAVMGQIKFMMTGNRNTTARGLETSGPGKKSSP